MKFTKKYAIYILILLSLAAVIIPVVTVSVIIDGPINILSDDDFEKYTSVGTGTESAKESYHT